MKPICMNCRYYRPADKMDAGIPGYGNWCSNSQSKEFRLRKTLFDTCQQFEAKNKKAPLWMRTLRKTIK